MGRIYWILYVCMITGNYVSGFSYLETSSYETHPCKRHCQELPGPLTCEYNFTIEHYQTLSRACYNCPHNISDCYRPHCIAAEGGLRVVKVVNRMMPGPAIHVCQGDTVVVNVFNQLGDFEGTSIHWHGILQQGTPHMDGVAMLTQCPIPVHSTFQYRFRVYDTGTHYWHAHAGMQRGDGIFGAFVVRETTRTPVMAHYDYDLPEHTITVQDWLDQYSSSKFSLHHHGMLDNAPSSILINGRGALFGKEEMDHSAHGGMSMSEDDDHSTHMETMTTSKMPMSDESMMSDEGHAHHMMTMTTSQATHSDHSKMESSDLSYTPHAVFHVRKGFRYRFRIISNGILNCPLKVSVDNHTIKVIASDGHDIEPESVDSITIFAGERYDIVVTADQPPGNYWIHVMGLGDCEQRKTYESSILRYSGAMRMNPHTNRSYELADRQGKSANPLKATTNIVTVGQMKSYQNAGDVFTAHNVARHYVEMDFNNVGNYRYVDPRYYDLATMMEMHTGDHANHLYALQLNHITHTMPMSPVLTQYHDVSEDVFCNETSTNGRCETEFCECVHRLKVALGEVVELVLISEGKNGMGNHPMHLHGYSFYVLGMEKLGKSITRAEVEELDKNGKLVRNLANPIKKDTVLVPDGGYTIIRFKADNPGFWLFHCHVDFHFALGMSMVIQVGEVHEMPRPPGNFPRCGSWKYSEEATSYSQCSTSTAPVTTMYFLYVLTMMFTGRALL